MEMTYFAGFVIVCLLVIRYLYRNERNISKEIVEIKERNKQQGIVRVKKESWIQEWGPSLALLFVIALGLISFLMFDYAKGGGTPEYPIYQSREQMNNPYLHFRWILPPAVLIASVVTLLIGGLIYLIGDSESRMRSSVDFRIHENSLKTTDYRKLKNAFVYFLNQNQLEYCCQAAEKIIEHPLFNDSDYRIKLRLAVNHFVLFSEKEYDTRQILLDDSNLKKSTEYFCQIFSEKTEPELLSFDRKESDVVCLFFYTYGWLIKVTGSPCESSSNSDFEYYRHLASKCVKVHPVCKSHYPDKFDYLA